MGGLQRPSRTDGRNRHEPMVGINNDIGNLWGEIHGIPWKECRRSQEKTKCSIKGFNKLMAGSRRLKPRRKHTGRRVTPQKTKVVGDRDAGRGVHEVN